MFHISFHLYFYNLCYKMFKLRNLFPEYFYLNFFVVLTYDDSSISEDGESLSLPSIEGVLPHLAHPKHQKVVGLPNVNMVKPAQTAVDEKKMNEEKQKEEESKKCKIFECLFFSVYKKCCTN